MALFGLLLVAPAAAAQADLTLELQDAPSCMALPFLPCVLGHDPGATPSLGDDEVHVYALVTRAGVRVDAPAGLPPVVFAMDYNATWVDHPGFVLLGSAGTLVDRSLPPPLDRAFAFHDSEQVMFGAVYFAPLVPLFEEDVGLGLPVFLYVPGFAERERLYPLRVWGDEPGDLDGFWVSLGAMSEVCPEEALLGTTSSCSLRATTLRHAAETGQASLPNVLLLPGVRQVQVSLEPRAAADLAASLGSARGSPPWDRPHLPGGISEEPAGAAATAVLAGLQPSAHPARVFQPAGLSIRGPLAGVLESLAHPIPWWVAGLLLAPLLWLFHRITGARALESAHRRHLLEVVEARPGLPMSELARALGLSHHTTAHHVGVLRRVGRVERVKAGRTVAVYPVGSVPLRHREALVHLRRGPQAALLALVAEHPGLGLTSLAALDGHGKSAVHAKLHRLHALGLVAREGDAYRATPLGLEALALARPSAAPAPTP